MDLKIEQIIKCDVKSFIPNNMVVLFEWDKPLNLADIFVSLPIVSVEGLPIIKGKKTKIPYFGIENVIVNIRYKNKSRGVRPFLAKPDNFVSVDLQIDQRNVHIKLSINNALVMGVTSFETAHEAIKCLLSIIDMVNKNLVYLRNIEEHIDENISTELDTYIKNLYEDVIPDYLTFENNLPNNIDKKLALIHLTYVYEMKTYQEYKNYINSVKAAQEISEINIANFSISNSGYNYRLKCKCKQSTHEFKTNFNFVLNRITTSINNYDIENNSEIGNIIASHHNWYSKYINIVITIKDKDKYDIHRFNVSEGGSIRQWSPVIVSEAYKVYNLFIDMLNNILDSTPCIYDSI
jgi:hypothetical protein